MSTFKRSISLLLAMIILVSVSSPAAQAAPAEDAASVNTDNVTIEGTNGFGNLLAQEITENQQESETEDEDYPGGYSVTDLEIVDNVATVTYDSMEEAMLVVALHTEDGMQLLTSTKVTVTADATKATVTFEGEMPEYFMASAYLLDRYDYSPLCASYETPMYTQEMQELLASTVDDYDPEKVLNLDNDETTNFAVYADSTVIIEPEEGTNIVESIDDENTTYVIKNADEQIISLAEGNVFVYPYAENAILIIKVASIASDGTTATITGAELEMSDVFSYVKIERTADVGKAVVHEGTGDECVTYNGIRHNKAVKTGQKSQIKPNAFEDDITVPIPSLEFGIDETFEDEEGNKITISGGVKFEADVSLKYYIALFSQYVRFQMDTTLGLNFTVAGTVELFEFELPDIVFDLIPQLVSVGSKPQVEVSFNGEIGWEGDVRFTVGLACGHNVPNQDLCAGPWVESKTNLKVGFSVKTDLQPNLSAKTTEFLELISARITCPVGFEVTTEQNGQSVVDAYGDRVSSIHTCQNCLKFELFGCVELGAEIVFLDDVKLVNKGDGLTITFPFKAKKKIHILSAYYSTDYKDFGFGSCPYESYRLTIEVLDSADQPVKNTSVYTTKESWGNTNKYGILATYVPEGTYELYTIVEEEELGVTIQINGPNYLKITPNEVLSNGNPGAGGTGSDTNPGNPFEGNDYVDENEIVSSGTCGENVEWCLYKNGILAISGKGKMSNYSSSSKIPWYNLRSDIVQVFIDGGVSSICDYAFQDCKNLSEVCIPDSVTAIGSSAFYGCTALREVVIPDGADTIGSSAFSGCRNLWYVVIGTGVNGISQSLFQGCEQLREIVIPASVIQIGKFAFDDCDGLQMVYYGGTERVWNKMVVRRAEEDYNESLLNAKVIFGAVDPVVFDGGVGSEKDPYLVSTAEQLQTVHEDLDAHYVQTADIDLCDVIWEPIGYVCTDGTSIGKDAVCAFTGSYNGQNHVIKNMTIIEISDLHRAVGLFGYNHGILRNIVLEDSMIILDVSENTLDNVMSGSQYYPYPCIGGIVGHSQGTVLDCSNSGIISVDIAYGDIVCVGGILGYGTGSRCTNDASIQASGDNGDFGGTMMLHCGGITGYPGAINEDVLYCVNYGDISCAVNQYTAQNHLDCGGITGVHGELIYCVNFGSVSGQINSNRNISEYCCVGGLSGESAAGSGNYSGIVNCANFGNVAAYNSTDKISCCAGGLFGQFGGEATNCYNLGEWIYADLHLVTKPDEYECKVGRVFGRGGGELNACYSLDTTTLGAGEPKYSEGQGISMSENEIYVAIEDILMTLNLSLDGENQAISESREAQSDSQALSFFAIKKDKTTNPDAVFGGEYGMEFSDSRIIKYACFDGLVPTQQYVMLALVSLEVDEPLAADNLLAIDQATASENGTLTFRYIQRTPCDVSYVVACGASSKNLNDAEITFPKMVADGELQVVDPIVVYDGVTLTEGRDYVITGNVDFFEASEYTCYIRGIRNYTGLVKCTYTVTEHNHSFTNYVSDGNATCTEDGTKTAKCDHCDATDTIPDAGSALGHDMGSWEITMPATCTENGKEQRNCSRCDHSESREIAAVGHSWDTGVVTREPTENAEGERLYTCTVCGATKTESIPVIGHEHRYEAVVTAPTCTEQGYTTYTCKCGESYVADYVEALGHSFGDWHVIQKPTTTEDGLEVRSCARCGHTEQRTIDKLENPFNDVTPSDFYYTPVLWALENNITSGTAPNEFSPYDSCLRSQVVTFLWRAAGKPAATSRVNPFVDVKPSDYYYDAVLWAVEKGITTGADATHFEPNGVCNRSQVVTFLYRAFDKPPVDNASNPFTDVKTGAWYADPVLWAVKEGITNGLTATEFAPNEVCNRSQVVTFLYRAYVD